MPNLSIFAALVFAATTGQISYSGLDSATEQDASPPPRQPLVSDTIVTEQPGQRQTREQIAQDAGIEPMARINGRIQNRVQSRIRNRIDRYYNPQANAASPFQVAGEQARAAGRSRR